MQFHSYGIITVSPAPITKPSNQIAVGGEMVAGALRDGLPTVQQVEHFTEISHRFVVERMTEVRFRVQAILERNGPETEEEEG
jgi:hypothetical protein